MPIFFYIIKKCLIIELIAQRLIRIADAVAAEKSIDKDLVLSSMETAIEKAARTRYGSENDIYVSIDRETGIIRTWSKIKSC